MRPRGEIRQVLAQAAGAQVGGATWRDLAISTQVGFDAARTTVQSMRRSGELVVIGVVRLEHSRRPLALYAPAPQADAYTEACVELTNAINGWAGFR